jgi:hypothetical protein
METPTLTKRENSERDNEQAEYLPTEREGAVLRKQAERRETETPALRVKVLSRGANLFVDHPDETIGREVLMEALGTANPLLAAAFFTY